MWEVIIIDIHFLTLKLLHYNRSLLRFTSGYGSADSLYSNSSGHYENLAKSGERSNR